MTRIIRITMIMATIIATDSIANPVISGNVANASQISNIQLPSYSPLRHMTLHVPEGVYKKKLIVKFVDFTPNPTLIFIEW